MSRCEHCNELFQPARTARFCSALCRKRAWLANHPNPNYAYQKYRERTRKMLKAQQAAGIFSPHTRNREEVVRLWDLAHPEEARNRDALLAQQAVESESGAA